MVPKTSGDQTVVIADRIDYVDRVHDRRTAADKPYGRNSASGTDARRCPRVDRVGKNLLAQWPSRYWRLACASVQECTLNHACLSEPYFRGSGSINALLAWPGFRAAVEGSKGRARSLMRDTEVA